MSDMIKKQDIEKIEKVISEIHNRWDHNGYSEKEERIYRRDTRYIEEKIQEIINEKPNISTEELFVSCWKKYSGQYEKEETLGFDIPVNLTVNLAVNLNVVLIAILTYYFMKTKLMSLKREIELIYSSEKKNKKGEEKKTYFKISL